jgi:hypothetical protein
LQSLRERARTADAEPPDHLLVVENEAGLREILQAEIRGYLGWPIQSCSLDIFAGEPACSVGAQVVAANHLVDETNPRVPWNWPVIGLAYARVAEHIEGVRKLRNPSIVAVVARSESLLTAARGLLTPAIGSRHTLSEVLADPEGPIRLGSADLVFCDTVTYTKVHFPGKILFRLVDAECLEHLAASLRQIRLATNRLS